MRLYRYGLILVRASLTRDPYWPTIRWFIITGTLTKSGISLLLGHVCGYNSAWLNPR